MNVKIHPSWSAVLQSEFDAPYFKELTDRVRAEYTQGQVRVFPPARLLFNAFDLTPFDEVKVVILGQDPYHNDGQAMGLSFSVPEGFPFPPSLQNIYKEMKDDLELSHMPLSGDLTYLARQGVFLLNTILTVRAYSARSHHGIGWERFTDSVIRRLSEGREHLVFMLWGSDAQSKAQFIDESKHLVLRAPHPSPLSAHRGFFGKHHFSKANYFLLSHHITPIQWAREQ